MSFEDMDAPRCTTCNRPLHVSVSGDIRCPQCGVFYSREEYDLMKSGLVSRFTASLKYCAGGAVALVLCAYVAARTSLPTYVASGVLGVGIAAWVGLAVAYGRVTRTRAGYRRAFIQCQCGVAVSLVLAWIILKLTFWGAHAAYDRFGAPGLILSLVCCAAGFYVLWKVLFAVGMFACSPIIRLYETDD